MVVAVLAFLEVLFLALGLKVFVEVAKFEEVHHRPVRDDPGRKVLVERDVEDAQQLVAHELEQFRVGFHGDLAEKLARVHVVELHLAVVRADGQHERVDRDLRQRGQVEVGVGVHHALRHQVVRVQVQRNVQLVDLRRAFEDTKQIADDVDCSVTVQNNHHVFVIRLDLGNRPVANMTNRRLNAFLHVPAHKVAVLVSSKSPDLALLAKLGNVHMNARDHPTMARATVLLHARQQDVLVVHQRPVNLAVPAAKHDAVLAQGVRGGAAWNRRVLCVHVRAVVEVARDKVSCVLVERKKPAGVEIALDVRCVEQIFEISRERATLENTSPTLSNLCLKICIHIELSFDSRYQVLHTRERFLSELGSRNRNTTISSSSGNGEPVRSSPVSALLPTS
ncbi:hypothetical protein OGAPHI_002991 [Ogataea philodendri]|uniref:Secreted protein n=1 Tax=Ogataea philodendri TaxID=1378263 RepID=A0A9P8P8P5_9ASCO|nr:uncharacterized protein OGAPHI_002991 [Ogataea philodendri]KAH3667342.1 hypothetical protein OGAPHI_002991 [Ogataea philodendri]